MRAGGDFADALACDIELVGGSNTSAQIVYFSEAACGVVGLSNVFATVGVVFADGAAKLVVFEYGAYTTGVEDCF